MGAWPAARTLGSRYSVCPCLPLMGCCLTCPLVRSECYVWHLGERRCSAGRDYVRTGVRVPWQAYSRLRTLEPHATLTRMTCVFKRIKGRPWFAVLL